MTSPQVQLIGFPPSTFYQTAALTLSEKGVTFVPEAPALADPGYTDLHPWRKIPVLIEAEFTIFETLAIAMYVDARFDGPPLQPVDIRERTNMFKWISIFLDYGVNSILQYSVRERFQKTLRKQEPDESIVARNRPAMNQFCGQLDRDLTARFVAGPAISIADLFLIPAMIYFANTPEGRDALATCPKLSSWLSRMKDRRSVKTICVQLDWIMEG